jgi:cytochrome c oxidase assembly protein subunit 15
VLTGAVALAAVVTLQSALGIWTLLMVAPISLALLHQATAMVVLTVATLHAQQVSPQPASVAFNPSVVLPTSPSA